MIKLTDYTLVLCPRCLGDEIGYTNDGERPRGWFCYDCKNNFKFAKRMKMSEMVALKTKKIKIPSLAKQ